MDLGTLAPLQLPLPHTEPQIWEVSFVHNVHVRVDLGVTTNPLMVHLQLWLQPCIHESMCSVSHTQHSLQAPT